MSIASEAIVAIGQLVARYNRSGDNGGGAAAAALFAPDGVLEVIGRRAEGREAVGALLALGGVEEGPPTTAHHVSNPVVELEGDEATGESDFLVHRRTDAGIEPCFAGRHHYAYRKVGGSWLCTRPATGSVGKPQSLTAPGRRGLISGRSVASWPIGSCFVRR